MQNAKVAWTLDPRQINLILTLFLAPTSEPRSINRSMYDVRLSLTAYINGVIPVVCKKKPKKCIKNIVFSRIHANLRKFICSQYFYILAKLHILFGISVRQTIIHRNEFVYTKNSNKNENGKSNLGYHDTNVGNSFSTCSWTFAFGCFSLHQ